MEVIEPKKEKKPPKPVQCGGRMCKHKGVKYCHAMSRFTCTRRKGHKGPHIACGKTGHNFEIWEDK